MTALRRPMVSLLSRASMGPGYGLFYENSIRASGGQALLLVFNNYHEILNVHTAEGSPKFRVSSRGRGLWLCVSLRLSRISSHHPLPRCAEVEGAARLQLNPWPLQTVERSNFQGNKNNHGNRDAVCDSWPLENRLTSAECPNLTKDFSFDRKGLQISQLL